MEIVNKVAASGIITLNLSEFYATGERIIYDFKDNLFMEMVLKEKDYREFLKTNDWEIYKDKNVAIICSANAIVPTWAYMLLAVYLEPVARNFVFGDIEALEKKLFIDALDTLDLEQFRDKRVVIKGCSDVDVPTAIYVEITKRLKPITKSLMFGEPCSTVPLFKNKI